MSSPSLANTIRSEWIKLRTVMVHWVLVIIAVGFPILVATLVALFTDIRSGTVDSSELAELVVGLAIVSSMLLGTTVAISLTAEFGHNTIRPTYAATPARARVLFAKVVINTVVVALIMFVTVMVSFLIAQVILSARGTTISLGDDETLTPLLLVVVLGILVSWFGFGLGLIIRNAPATVSILLLWPLVVESLLALVLFLLRAEGAQKYLPYQAALSATTQDEGSVDILGRPGGQILFGIVALAIIGVGTMLDAKRDA